MLCCAMGLIFKSHVGTNFACSDFFLGKISHPLLKLKRNNRNRRFLQDLPVGEIHESPEKSSLPKVSAA